MTAVPVSSVDPVSTVRFRDDVPAVLPDYTDDDEVPLPTQAQLIAFKRHLQTPPSDQKTANKRSRSCQELTLYMDTDSESSNSSDNEGAILTSNCQHPVYVDFPPSLTEPPPPPYR